MVSENNRSADNRVNAFGVSFVFSGALPAFFNSQLIFIQINQHTAIIKACQKQLISSFDRRCHTDRHAAWRPQLLPVDFSGFRIQTCYRIPCPNDDDLLPCLFDQQWGCIAGSLFKRCPAFFSAFDIETSNRSFLSSQLHNHDVIHNKW